MRKLILSLVALTCLFAALPAAGQNQYQLKQKYTIGGDGSWDYLTYQPGGKRLFISRGTRVLVVDQAKSSFIIERTGNTYVHGITLSHELGHGFSIDDREYSLTV